MISNPTQKVMLTDLILGEQYRDLIKEANEAWLGDRTALFSTPSNADAIKLTMLTIQY